jgi:hypothetical protein
MPLQRRLRIDGIDLIIEQDIDWLVGPSARRVNIDTAMGFVKTVDVEETEIISSYLIYQLLGEECPEGKRLKWSSSRYFMDGKFPCCFSVTEFITPTLSRSW